MANDADDEEESWAAYSGGACVIEIDGTDKVPAVRWDEPDDQVVINCAGCKVPILTFWKPGGGGGLLRGEYVLVADWIYHPKCFDEVYKDVP